MLDVTMRRDFNDYEKKHTELHCENSTRGKYWLVLRYCIVVLIFSGLALCLIIGQPVAQRLALWAHDEEVPGSINGRTNLGKITFF